MRKIILNKKLYYKNFTFILGVDSNYAEYLFLSWIKVLREKNVQQPIKIFLFSNSKYSLKKLIESANLNNVKIQDYFSIDLKNENQNIYEELIDFSRQNSDSIFLIDCLSTLALQIGIAKACTFVEKLYQSHKSQIFCIYRRDLCLNIPRVETLGDVYIKLEKSRKLSFESNIHYQISVLHKKPGGGVARWNESVVQNTETYKLELGKISDNISKPEISSPSESTIKPQTSFRIEMSEEEIKQRDSVPLPYILPGNPGSGKSKIIYVPDDVDDLDEEDPDDDLDF